MGSNITECDDGLFLAPPVDPCHLTISMSTGRGLVTETKPADMSSDISADVPQRIGLIDSYQFSQECLIEAFAGLHPRPIISPFTTVQECLSNAPDDIDLIVYYSHASETTEQTTIRNISAIRAVFTTVRLIVFADAEDAMNPEVIRTVLQSGAQGFVSTRSTGIPVAFAAIRFIAAGGIFAPLDLLLANPPALKPHAARQHLLTFRQMDVLFHLQQGKANKSIAHALCLSESSVKAHVRNIMRKLGATNRTQVVYMARELLTSPREVSTIDKVSKLTQTSFDKSIS